MYLMLKVRKGSESSHQDCLRHKIIKLLERSKGFFIASKIFMSVKLPSWTAALRCPVPTVLADIFNTFF